MELSSMSLKSDSYLLYVLEIETVLQIHAVLVYMLCIISSPLDVGKICKHNGISFP